MALQDILNSDLADNPQRIIVNKIYQSYFDRDVSHLQSYLRTPKIAIRSLRDVYSLIRRAIVHYEIREGISDENKITFTEENPDKKNKSEVISVCCSRSVPGAFSQGSPMEGKIKNLRYMPREEQDDPDHPGYKVATLGYWMESVVKLTCWARTNKAANKRVDWLQDIMFEYDWWFCAEGISRIIFIERKEDKVLEVDGNKWYGRPLDYFVKTEKIKMLSERKLEEIYINLVLSAR